MNASIIAAIITASVSLLIWWLTHRSKVSPLIQPSPTNTIVVPTLPKRRTTDLSHKQILDCIDAVPPLQRDGILASFVGVYVSWPGRLFGASKVAGKMLVHLRAKDDVGIHCLSELSDCDLLLVAAKGTKVIV